MRRRQTPCVNAWAIIRPPFEPMVKTFGIQKNSGRRLADGTLDCILKGSATLCQTERSAKASPYKTGFHWGWFPKMNAMFFDLERIRANVAGASSEDLLDRITIWRAGMEESALAIIEEELRRRDITSYDIALHEEMRSQNLIILGGGYPARCCECFRPAVQRVVAWHRVWGVVPLFRRSFYYCEKHTHSKR